MSAPQPGTLLAEVSLCGLGEFKQPDEPRTLDFSNSQLARAALTRPEDSNSPTDKKATGECRVLHLAMRRVRGWNDRFEGLPEVCL
jgi:hypothetical protein